MGIERQRLRAANKQQAQWYRWGPYLSERQWGTVREDYSDNGDAWSYFPHDHARSRAYRWGEDGLGGICDEGQHLCWALALWNGNDSILKERLFGLTNAEGNHGEDVKEYYFYLDSTPTHSYMRYLYKYPQCAFPYEDLVKTSTSRNRYEPEYELLDTGAFDASRYFDVFVEYAKESPTDIIITITAHNRGLDAAPLHILPTLWFRNTWSHTSVLEVPEKPRLHQTDSIAGASVVYAQHPAMESYYMYCDGSPLLLFTENETNWERINGTPNPNPFVKDGINAFIVDGHEQAVNPERRGTKVAAHYQFDIPAGGSASVQLRLTTVAPDELAKAYGKAATPFGSRAKTTITKRKKEADEFYASLAPAAITAEAANVMRQALAGMLWTKQFYNYHVSEWLREHGIEPTSTEKSWKRNRAWFHMVNHDIISMPDKWEYPWYAAWDLAFHTVVLAMVDIDFAKRQLLLMLEDDYMHPNGQMPAYEWNFGDVNPPVHAWATMIVYHMEAEATGTGDLDWLRQVFTRLMLYFTWWVNRKDPDGSNVFEGGFLGLDNIGVFDRSAPTPMGGRLEQADGTAWMALFSLNMLSMAIQIGLEHPTYQEIASKFYKHFLWINAAMDRIGVNEDELWDEADGFFYDVLRFPDGSSIRLKVRSMVGLLSLAACTVVQPEQIKRLPILIERIREFNAQHPELVELVPHLGQEGLHGRRLLSILNEAKLRRILTYMLDENEFLSPYGIRALSRYHADNPYTLYLGSDVYRVEYVPGDSTSGMFGGNSNWRGPIWFPVNMLIISALIAQYSYYGDDFTIECPTGSGREMTLWQVSREIALRLTRIFLPNSHGQRPVYGGTAIFHDDPHWRDLILFYEYFHGDNGAGIGASHQTGWTGLVARLIQMYTTTTASEVRESGDMGALA